MQIFEITAKSIPGVRWFSKDSIAALSDKLDAYNFAQAGLTRPNDSAGSSAYGDMRSKAAAAADPLIDQMAANEMANWNQTLTNAMKSAGVNTPGALPPATRRAISNSFMARVFQYFLEGKLGDNLNDFPEMVDKKSRSEANTLLTKLNAAVRGILNYYSPATTPEGQFQQWKDLSKATYDMRSLMQFNPAANSQRQQMQVMPPIVIGPGTTGSVKIRAGHHRQCKDWQNHIEYYTFAHCCGRIDSKYTRVANCCRPSGQCRSQRRRCNERHVVVSCRSYSS